MKVSRTVLKTSLDWKLYRLSLTTRLQLQGGMTLEEMLDDLPKSCDVGSSSLSHGYKETWIGDKQHIDTRKVKFQLVVF